MQEGCAKSCGPALVISLLAFFSCRTELKQESPIYLGYQPRPYLCVSAPGRTVLLMRHMTNSLHFNVHRCCPLHSSWFSPAGCYEGRHLPAYGAYFSTPPSHFGKLRNCINTTPCHGAKESNYCSHSPDGYERHATSFPRTPRLCSCEPCAECRRSCFLSRHKPHAGSCAYSTK